MILSRVVVSWPAVLQCPGQHPPVNLPIRWYSASSLLHESRDQRKWGVLRNTFASISIHSWTSIFLLMVQWYKNHNN